MNSRDSHHTIGCLRRFEPTEVVGRRLAAQLAARFGAAPHETRVVFAPYRVCPLGAHIDHQLGHVTAWALDQGVLLAFAPLETPEVRLASLDFPGQIAFRFDEVIAPPDRRALRPRAADWGEYARGAVAVLGATYPLRRGLVGLVAGSMAESGLSSSAAVGVAYLLALEAVNRLDVAPLENVRLDQAIENGYLGLRNGVLDPAAVLLSRENHLTWVDCRSLEHQCVGPSAIMPLWALLLVHSGVRRSLVTTDYNRRVGECAEAARQLLEALGRPADTPVLRGIAPGEYERLRDRLAGPAARRAAHYFGEMHRVEQGLAAWRAGNLAELGRLISDSGRSSIENYQCGAEPLVELYHRLLQTEGVYGARFSGAGFRGCCVALIAPAAAETVAQRVLSAYRQRFPELADHAWATVCRSAGGATLEQW